MADNVTLPGTGAVVGADEVTDATLGTIKVQYVKLMDGTLDGTTKAAVGANGLAVDVKAAPVIHVILDSGTISTLSAITAGETHLGSVGGNTTVITVAVAMTTHATYVSGDFVGTDHTALVFANAARVNTGAGSVIGAVLIDYALQSVPCELWLFDTEPAGLDHDSAAFTLTDASVCIGVIPFNTYYGNALNSVSVGNIPNGQLPFKSSATSLWGALVTRGAPAYASNDVNIRLTIAQD